MAIHSIEKTPERCCLYCKYGSVKSSSILCKNEESLYFESNMNKKDRCPEFKREKK